MKKLLLSSGIALAAVATAHAQIVKIWGGEGPLTVTQVHSPSTGRDFCQFGERVGDANFWLSQMDDGTINIELDDGALHNNVGIDHVTLVVDGGASFIVPVRLLQGSTTYRADIPNQGAGRDLGPEPEQSNRKNRIGMAAKTQRTNP
jgi:hypothetical protein